MLSVESQVELALLVESKAELALLVESKAEHAIHQQMFLQEIPERISA